MSFRNWLLVILGADVACFALVGLVVWFEGWQFGRDQRRLAREWQQRDELELLWVLPPREPR